MPNDAVIPGEDHNPYGIQGRCRAPQPCDKRLRQCRFVCCDALLIGRRSSRKDSLVLLAVLDATWRIPVPMDRLILWLINLLLEEPEISFAADVVFRTSVRHQASTIPVSNETRQGNMPEASRGRHFLDEAG